MAGKLHWLQIRGGMEGDRERERQTATSHMAVYSNYNFPLDGLQVRYPYCADFRYFTGLSHVRILTLRQVAKVVTLPR